MRGDLERAVAEAAVARPDAAARGYKLLAPGEARAVNPALRGDFDAALYCERDAAVEPRTAQLALRAELLKSPGYTFLPDREVREVVGERAVRDDHGEVHTGDAVVLCTGAWLAASCASWPDVKATDADAIALTELMDGVEVFEPDWADIEKNLTSYIDAWKEATGS